MMHADGKVVTPLFKGKAGDLRVDKRKGKIRQVRHEIDASLHFEGDGGAVWGTKFVVVAARSAAEGSGRRRASGETWRRSAGRDGLLQPPRSAGARDAGNSL